MAETTLSVPVTPPKSRFAASLRNWLGVAPFLLFAFLFLLLPSVRLLIGSFFDRSGQFTLDNVIQLFSQPLIVNAYWLSLRISAVTALGGGIFGFLLAYAVTVGGLPRPLRSILITFSGVASNFAGVPLAFAFVATLGRTGFITALLKQLFNINLYDAGFNLYSFAGLSLTYMYFQFPLMVLIMAPALDGLKREWREASENLGASSFYYWRRVALPVLLPSILGAMVLLFGNAFGAYATAYALTGGSLPIVTIQIGAQIRGDVLHNPGLGYAMAMGMVVIMAVSLAANSWLQQRTERWLR
ncbi:MAG: ABC transporter permease subunit [Chloroflexi bacterium]|jgi:putative spermidine/putrescine transport system permease protein|nr:ABC transporter permease subunit [Anaerolineaceae bacterium]NMB88142.1 ABC transporter permease subunit [Chloroflexota bacterium]